MEFHYPNESPAYREARNALAVEEAELIRRVKAVAEQRQALPLGGRLKEDYQFTWANDARLGQTIRFAELFGDQRELLLYNLMFAPGWDNPCPSCTSIVDGLDRMAYQVGHDAALFVVAKAEPERINAWAKARGWNQIALISGLNCTFQADYGCQMTDDRQIPKLNAFQKSNGEIYHFWGSEIAANDIDMVWPYWNLMDLLPSGRPDRNNPPQNFRSRYLEDNYSS